MPGRNESEEQYAYTSVHAAVLVAELEDGARLVNALSTIEYDRLISRYQQTASELITALISEEVPVGEVHALGGLLVIAFYDRDEVNRNYGLDGPESLQGTARRDMIERCRKANQGLAVKALQAAIRFKNDWLVQRCNVDRVRMHLAPWELGIGLHYGRVYLMHRPIGGRRIEGRALELARSVRTASCYGRYSRIMLSQQIKDVLARAVLKHTQLRQRVFFHEHRLPLEQHSFCGLDGKVQELKFFHRIGIHVSEDVIEQYQAVLHLDQSNIWAYYQLVDHYAYVANDWNEAIELIKRVRVTHPADEKSLLDLAKYYLHHDKIEQSRLCAEEVLQLNSAFDLAHEHLAVIASKQDDFALQISHLRRAMSLSPDSAVNNLNLGLALLEAGNDTEGYFFVQEALRIFPDYQEWQVFRESLLKIQQVGKLPQLLEGYIEYKEQPR